jgi:hypothetical protein
LALSVVRHHIRDCLGCDFVALAFGSGFRPQSRSPSSNSTRRNSTRSAEFIHLAQSAVFTAVGRALPHVLAKARQHQETA